MTLPKLRILIAEDEEINVLIARHILGKMGHELISVENGEQAVEKVTGESFHLILMDVEMPVMDGLEATKLIRQSPNGKHTPIIALTAHSLPEKIDEIRKAGMDDVLIKPFEEKNFLPILEKYIPLS